MMLDLLDRRIKQMHKALGDLSEPDLSSIVIDHRATPQGFYCEIDFSRGTTEIELRNIADLLVANIACLKDHLKVWCRTNGKSFEGDELIDSNRDVALIHDLWNVSKHVELNRAPRSGHHPEIKNLKRLLTLSGGDKGSSFAFNPFTGQARTSGSVSLTVTGDVVDKDNNTRLGDFAGICVAAAAAWQHTIARAGVSIPAESW